MKKKNAEKSLAKTSEVSIKKQFDEIDKEAKILVSENIGKAFFSARKEILLGMWKKGKIIDFFMKKSITDFSFQNKQTHKTTLSYRDLEEITGRDRRSITEWHSLYKTTTDIDEYIKTIESKAKDWTEKALKKSTQKLISECCEDMEEIVVETVIKEKTEEDPEKIAKFLEGSPVREEVIDAEEIINENVPTILIPQQNLYESKNYFEIPRERLEFIQWHWNPMEGCGGDCYYCYLKEPGGDGILPMKFFPERLELSETVEGKSGNVFVCQNGDLFSDGSSDEWIRAILEVVEQHPEFKFLFLTKFPQRMSRFNFSDNSMVGVTIDYQPMVDPAMEMFKTIKAKHKFISCEPIIEPIGFPDGGLEDVDLLILGAMRPGGREQGGFQPQWEWVEGLLAQARDYEHLSIYFKPSLIVRPKELPHFLID